LSGGGGHERDGATTLERLGFRVEDLLAIRASAGPASLSRFDHFAERLNRRPDPVGVSIGHTAHAANPKVRCVPEVGHGGLFPA